MMPSTCARRCLIPATWRNPITRSTRTCTNASGIWKWKRHDLHRLFTRSLDRLHQRQTGAAGFPAGGHGQPLGIWRHHFHAGRAIPGEGTPARQSSLPGRPAHPDFSLRLSSGRAGHEAAVAHVHAGPARHGARAVTAGGPRRVCFGDRQFLPGQTGCAAQSAQRPPHDPGHFSRGRRRPARSRRQDRRAESLFSARC